MKHILDISDGSSVRICQDHPDTGRSGASGAAGSTVVQAAPPRTNRRAPSGRAEAPDTGALILSRKRLPVAQAVLLGLGRSVPSSSSSGIFRHAGNAVHLREVVEHARHQRELVRAPEHALAP